MAERRSRSQTLQAKALEQGVAVSELRAGTSEDEQELEALEMKPAFDMESLESGLVSENELQSDETQVAEVSESVSDEVLEETVEDAIEPESDLTTETQAIQEMKENEVPIEAADCSEMNEGAVDKIEEYIAEKIPADPGVQFVEEEACPSGESRSSLEDEPELETQATEEVVDNEVLEPEERVESALPSSEDLIDDDGDLLGDAPEPIADAESLMAAEELVDRIGAVVDIQSLPKTQPSRVMSKVSKSEQPAEGKREPDPVESPKSMPVSKAPPTTSKPDPTAAKPKKKKKKATLLDSYFKGL